MKHVSVLPENQTVAKKLVAEMELAPLLARVLAARGLTTPEEVQQFVETESGFEDPFALIDMDKAVARLNLAIEEGQQICIYGDYDADGVCATALLTLYLRDMGVAVRPFIPLRQDGYGMNKEALQLLADEGIQLVITVDNGVVSVEETAFANSLGLDVIITDHHQPRSVLPQAVAVVNPHRADCPSQFKELSGAGVVFKLIAAMEDGAYDLILENYGDIVAIATIADMMPLVLENRFLVKEGLNHLAHTDNPGLSALVEALNLGEKTITSRDVAFRIAPRINAAGRMGKAEEALALFLAEDDESAAEIVRRLEENNTERQALEAKIQSDIDFELLTNPKRFHNSVVVLSKAGWSHGVIGICASRLVERLGKPCFLLEENGEKAKGSGRGVEGLSLSDMLVTCDDLLFKYGGHKGAAGLTILTDNLDALRKRFDHFVGENCKTMPVDHLVADLSITPKDLTLEGVRALSLLEPFGFGNESIRFLLLGAKIEQIYPLGDGRHIKIRASLGGDSVDVLAFGVNKSEFSYVLGDVVDLVVTAEPNVYQGKESVSCKLKHIQPHQVDETLFFQSWLYYDQLMRGDRPKKQEVALIAPTREDIGQVFRFLSAHPGYHQGLDVLAVKMGSNYGKLRLSLMILEELKLVSIKREGRGEWIDVIPQKTKTDLSKSRLFARIGELI